MKMDTHDRIYSCNITRQHRAVPGSVVQRQRAELAGWANECGRATWNSAAIYGDEPTRETVR